MALSAAALLLLLVGALIGLALVVGVLALWLTGRKGPPLSDE
jgi:hypothetical protein